MRVRWIRTALLCSTFLSACSASDSNGSQPATGGASSGSSGGLGTGAGGAGGFISNGGSLATGGILPSFDRPDASAPACAHADVSYERIVPTVWLMIDASGSMNGPLQLGGAPRYQLVRDALLTGQTGIVGQLEKLIRFGLYLYDGCGFDPSIIGPGCVAGACPRVSMVEPALDNAAPIGDRYPAVPPGTSTPTDVALAGLADHIGANVSTGGKLPSYVVLATDGEPNLCDWHDGIPSNDIFRQNAVDAVQRMVAAGTKVFVISLAGQDPALQAYLDRVAAAGGTGQPAFIPGNNDDLVNALRKILSGAVGCEVKLTGTIAEGKECSGTVTFDGKALPCGDPNGWRAKDTSTIELVGTSCADLQKDPTSNISVAFPCDVYVPIR